jgi:hypothetical protein
MYDQVGEHWHFASSARAAEGEKPDGIRWAALNRNTKQCIDRRRCIALLTLLGSSMRFAVGASAAGGLDGRSTVPTYSRGEIPMFKEATEARAETIKRLMIEGGIDPPVTLAEVEHILSHLAPQLWIGPISRGEATLGSTRFGGIPDLPTRMTWPLRFRPMRRRRSPS